MSEAYKVRSITYKRDDKKVEYLVIDGDGFVSTASPMAWHKLKLPDRTPDSALNEACEIRYRKTQTQLNKQVDDNAWLRAEGILNDPMRMVKLCAHLGIRV